MKRVLAISALITAFAAQASAAIYGFSAPILNAQQEVQGSSSRAYGSGSFTVDTVSYQITGSVTTTNQAATEVTGFHIHQAPTGVNGPVIVNLMPLLVGGSPITSGNVVTWIFDGTISGSSAQQLAKLNAMVAGDTYFNFHTPANPAGAIRGQIDCVAVPEPGTIAALGLGALVLLRRKRK